MSQNLKEIMIRLRRLWQGFRSRLHRNQPRPLSKPAQVGPTDGTDPLDDRIRRTVSALLDDEGLTQDLDDAVASQLLAWGADLARQLVVNTAALDDGAAQEVLDAGLRRIRRLLRRTGNWIATTSATTSASLSAASSAPDLAQGLQGVWDAAVDLYGTQIPELNPDWVQTLFRQESGTSPVQQAETLRRLLEQSAQSDLASTDDVHPVG